MAKGPGVLFVSQTALGASPTNRYVQLCRYLGEQGYKTTLFFVGKGKEPQDRNIRYPRRLENTTVRTSPAIPLWILRRRTVLASLLGGAWLLTTCLPLLVAHCARHSILHLGKPLPYGAFLAFLACRITRTPLVVDLDDWEGVGGFATLKQGRNAFAKSLISYFEEWIPTKSNAVVVVSNLLRERVCLAGVPPNRVFHIPNGADIARFSPSVEKADVREQYRIAPHESILGYLGTFKPGGANWQFMIDIFKRVRMRGASVRLMLIGFGPQLEQAREYAEQQGVAEHVVITGKVDHRAVPGYLAAADVLLLPYSDRFPHTLINTGRSSLKLYEYMAMGKPIVASDIGELSEALSDGAGILVKGNIPEHFADAITTLLAEPRSLQKFGRKARALAEKRYNYGRLAQDLAKVYDRVLKSGPAAGTERDVGRRGPA